MKTLAIAALFLVTPFVAFAETISTGGGFMFGGRAPDPTPAVSPSPKPALAPVPAALPAPKPQPLVSPVASGPAPFQASVAIGSTRCPQPVAHPNAANTPVKVYVDQQTQTVRIVTPDRPQPVESVVSTGGGLKVPNGRLNARPYCARTPKKDRLVVSAVTEDMYKGSGCTPDEIRENTTVFDMYHSRTFTDKDGNEVPMPKAVRIMGGIFFHEVPPSYAKMLGHNVSGECVRLKPAVAKFLNDQIRKWGAIEVNITDPPEVASNMPQYCTPEMVADARRRQQMDNGSQFSATPTPRATGTEGVYGGEESFFSALGRIFQFNRPRG